MYIADEENHSCEGGLPDNAFKYIIKNGGIDTEDSYRYLGHVSTIRLCFISDLSISEIVIFRMKRHAAIILLTWAPT